MTSIETSQLPIGIHRKGGSFVATYYVDGKLKSKAFSVKQHGHLALDLAVSFRNEKYGEMGRRPADFNSGVTGVTWYCSSGRTGWLVRYRCTVLGKRLATHFPCTEQQQHEVLEDAKRYLLTVTNGETRKPRGRPKKQ